MRHIITAAQKRLDTIKAESLPNSTNTEDENTNPTDYRGAEEHLEDNVLSSVKKRLAGESRKTSK
jgi:hypothetical protein